MTLIQKQMHKNMKPYRELPNKPTQIWYKYSQLIYNKVDKNVLEKEMATHSSVLA